MVKWESTTNEKLFAKAHEEILESWREICEANGWKDNPPLPAFHDPFANGNAPQFFGFLLQDHGWGGNYDRFGRGGLLEKIMTRSKVCPHFVLTAHDGLYDGYARVEWTEPAGSRGRCLFFNVDIGCQPPWAPTDDIPKMSAEEFFELEGDYQA